MRIHTLARFPQGYQMFHNHMPCHAKGGGDGQSLLGLEKGAYQHLFLLGGTCNRFTSLISSSLQSVLIAEVMEAIVVLMVMIKNETTGGTRKQRAMTNRKLILVPKCHGIFGVLTAQT